jgi:thioredoxin-like negative regulator of GroEL
MTISVAPSEREGAQFRFMVDRQWRSATSARDVFDQLRRARVPNQAVRIVYGDCYLQYPDFQVAEAALAAVPPPDTSLVSSSPWYAQAPSERQRQRGGRAVRERGYR